MQPKDDPSLVESKTADPPRVRKRGAALLLVALSLCLVLSLIGNIRLYMLMRAYAERAFESRVDLVGEQEYAAANAALGDPPPGVVRMVFVGDSDVEHWEPLPEVQGAQVIARGLGGERSGDLLVRLERDVVGLKPAVAVITVGGNDLEDIALFPAYEDALVTICERNLRAIVDRLRQRGIQVVLLTILPYGDGGVIGDPLWSDATYGAVARVNAVLRTLNGPGVTVVDCDRILAQPNGRRIPAYSHDMIHLNTAGYQALDDDLTPVLESLVRQEGRRPAS